MKDSFIIKNSQLIVEELRCAKFDVVDLYYSLPQLELMKCVKECITEDNNKLNLQNECGLKVQTFLELLMFYLQSTLIFWEGKTMVQKARVCVGSKVAPVLSDIFLGKVDSRL